MKTRFSTLDIIACVEELNTTLRGLRVHQIYDTDHKTYLIRFSKSNKDESQTARLDEETSKCVLLIESGIRVHLTEYNWTKNSTPSGFTMKLRKHLKNKRLESIRQLGVDRVLDLQFGINEASYHLIVELYDKGNLVITDYQYLILNVLRPRKTGENEDVKFMVKEIYPLETAKKSSDISLPTANDIEDLVEGAKPNDNLRKLLNPKVIFGPAVLEHCFIEVGFEENVKIRNIKKEDYSKIRKSLEIADAIMNDIRHNHKGYIIQQTEFRPVENGANENNEVITYTEFHPFLFHQHKNSTKSSYKEFESFNKAVDIFFSSIEAQKIDRRALQAEKDALKKLENVKCDHEKRIKELLELQEIDKRKANLIQLNSDVVEKALFVIRSAIANQMSWEDIEDLINEAQSENDPIASLIKGLKLNKNQFTMNLKDPYETESVAEMVDINIDLSAHANARSYYTQKRHAAQKQQKTIESSTKALKNAELKTKQALKDVAIKTSITKARKVLWFEKFFWFISSDGYLVIAGRDAQQNELIVKRYFKAGDVYVHADLHGASSVIIKNRDPTQQIPPKTLEEAGTMAVCYSSAWEAKIVPKAWYVFHDQVSKTAPTGEYLTPGAFMIRGKKNYLPLTQLIMGFGFIFRLDEESIERHKDDRNNQKRESVTVGEDESNNCDVEINVDDGESDGEFPDTRIRTLSVNANEEDIETAIVGGESSSMLIKAKQPRVKKQQKKKKTDVTQVKQITQEEPNNAATNRPLKRGQKGKLKKLKEKYKDQDDEERELRMAILGSIPKSDKMKNKGKKEKVVDLSEKIKELKVQQNNNNDEILENDTKKDDIEINTNSDYGEETKNDELVENKNETLKEFHEKRKEIEIEENEMDDDEDEEATSKPSEYISLVESLTGQPFLEDVLLYTIPIVAPYSALQHYKYKVKVLPGFHKRGKAAKTSLHLFVNDKSATQREKDLLKNAKDQDLARNIPNKVKISAQNMSTIRSKK
ncbi:nuclear export mediator factor NEMF-like protein [Leptotrombidium deliense]|uniref:Nuclear export mediator factor NEMF-like protein n=1 Tax=Leptotrombidium deliense TaxID=299467 RepID=A0A443SLG8_9ACAR|nr:nuclear export mediator factor NEMF-like protein [Leptotrombidium deliense]